MRTVEHMGENEPMTMTARPEPPSAEELRAHEADLLEPMSEDDLIAQLREGAQAIQQHTQAVEGKLPNGKLFYFRVRGLDEEEDDNLLKKHQKRRKEPRVSGTPLVSEVDSASYRAERVIKATTAFCIPVEYDEMGEGDDKRKVAVRFRDVPPLWESSQLREGLMDRTGNPVVDNLKVVDVLLGAIGITTTNNIIDSLMGVPVREVAKNS